jgi:hypothetical protein
MRILTYLHSFVMQNGFPYPIDRLLKSHHSKYTVKPFCSPQNKVLFKGISKVAPQLGSTQNQKYKQIGVICYRGSKATHARLARWHSRQTAIGNALRMFAASKWVIEGKISLIELPAHLQPSCQAVCNKVIVLGHTSGTISIFGLKEGPKLIGVA